MKSSTGSRRVSLVSFLVGLSFRTKRVIVIGYDLLVSILALYAAFVLRVGDPWPTPILRTNIALFIIVPPLCVSLFYFSGLYRVVIRFLHLANLKSLTVNVVVITLAIYFIGWFYTTPQMTPFSRSVPVIFGLLLLILVAGGRLLLRGLYLSTSGLSRFGANARKIVIFGAGHAGALYANALTGTGKYMPVCFIDDDPQKWNKTIYGLKVLNPAMLDSVLADVGVAEIIVAIPSLTASERNKLLDRLEAYQVAVKMLRSGDEFLGGSTKNEVRDVEIEDILGRDAVAPNVQLVASCIEAKSILVTGAGGSIGSMLAEQSLIGGASTLVLYEQSEFALYEVERKLRSVLPRNANKVRIVPVLGSILDQKRLRTVLDEYGTDVVFHAAAYKHVPLVEHNAVMGLSNNAVGTSVVAEEAMRAGVDRFVLVSTDKAVRPTNVMGATKRLAELFVQGLAEASEHTIFAIVRFGNVLGSSGSVIPLFKEQIKQGGPVTVTHPNITRYFMTIPEAASLVVQAGAMAKGGEVYVLDMGEPVRISELAEKLVHLSGYSVKTDDDPSGDIEIKFTGLRPGEKLYEELLIGNNVMGTSHPKIMQAFEDKLDVSELAEIKSEILSAIETGDSLQCRRILKQTVSGYTQSPVVRDVLPPYRMEDRKPREQG